MDESKYNRIEYERRFLVEPNSDWRSCVEPYSKVLEDKYLRGTRLRLRRLTDSDSGRQVFKLTKKEVSDSPYFGTISRILLSEAEYEIFARLDGDEIRKTRYYHHYKNRVFSIDVFEGELAGLVLCETEAESLEDLMRAEPPPYSRIEVTEDGFFTGGNLCRTSNEELLNKLQKLGAA